MKNLWSKLTGYKTYLAAIAIGILGILRAEGLVTVETAELLGPILLALAGLALRAGTNHAAEAANQPLVEELSRLKNLLGK